MKARRVGKRIFLVNRDLQFRYAKIGLLVGVVSTALCALVIFFPLYKFEIIRIPKFLPMPILSAMVLAVILNLALVMFFGIIITHRIAGPVFALSREFADISQGIFGRTLSSRRNDDLRYLVRCFNDMSQALQNLTHDDVERLTFLLDQAQELESSEKLQELIKNMENFRDELSQRIHVPEPPLHINPKGESS